MWMHRARSHRSASAGAVRAAFQIWFRFSRMWLRTTSQQSLLGAATRAAEILRTEPLDCRICASPSSLSPLPLTGRRREWGVEMMMMTDGLCLEKAVARGTSQSLCRSLRPLLQPTHSPRHRQTTWCNGDVSQIQYCLSISQWGWSWHGMDGTTWIASRSSYILWRKQIRKQVHWHADKPLQLWNQATTQKIKNKSMNLTDIWYWTYRTIVQTWTRRVRSS